MIPRNLKIMKFQKIIKLQNQKQKYIMNHEYELKVKSFINDHLTKNDVFKQGIIDIQYMTGSYYIGQVSSDYKNLINYKSLSHEKALSDQKISQYKGFSTNKGSFNQKYEVNQMNSVGQQFQKRQGQGVYYFSNGDIYFGRFLQNKFHELGTYIFHNDQYFKGTFNMGQSLKGQYHYKNGNVYYGDFRNYLPNGYGRMNFYNDKGRINYFQGNFIDGIEHGKGIFFLDKQLQIHGIWIKGQLTHGKVTYLYNNSFDQYNNKNFHQYYEGEFFNNKFHGKGKYVFSPTSYCQGEFSFGKMNGKGAIVYQNGDYYQGFFQNGKKNGIGTYFYRNGQICNGRWILDINQKDQLR